MNIGLKRTLIAFAGCTVAAGAFANVLFDNGGLATHFGVGDDNATLSMLAPGTTSLGGNTTKQATGDHFRRADDFTVTGPGWFLDTVTFFGYQTGPNSTTPAVPDLNGVSVRFWSGLPGEGSLLGEFNNFTQESAGIFRNGVNNTTSRQREVYAFTTNLGGFALAAGTYWVDFQVESDTTIWMPSVVLPSADPNNPNTTQMPENGNARGLSSTGWVPIIDGGSSATPLEYPFVLTGEPIPEPATMIALGLGAGLLAARRRRAK